MRKIAGSKELLRPVNYQKQPGSIIDPIVLVSPESNLPILLSQKSDQWSYEKEWRLIIELNRTNGTGETDLHGQPVNLVPIPNETVVSVHYTERTPPEAIRAIRERLADENNRYRADRPRKLVMDATAYGYEEAED